MKEESPERQLARRMLILGAIIGSVFLVAALLGLVESYRIYQANPVPYDNRATAHRARDAVHEGDTMDDVWRALGVPDGTEYDPDVRGIYADVYQCRDSKKLLVWYRERVVPVKVIRVQIR